MRTCARMNCRAQPAATISLRYADRVVVVGDLLPERDPSFLDLCVDHLARMTPPVGWSVERSSMAGLTAGRT